MIAMPCLNLEAWLIELGLIRSLGMSPKIQQILDVTEVVCGLSADCHTLLLKFHDSLKGADETATCYHTSRDYNGYCAESWTVVRLPRKMNFEIY